MQPAQMCSTSRPAQLPPPQAQPWSPRRVRCHARVAQDSPRRASASSTATGRVEAFQRAAPVGLRCRRVVLPKPGDEIAIAAARAQPQNLRRAGSHRAMANTSRSTITNERPSSTAWWKRPHKLGTHARQSGKMASAHHRRDIEIEPARAVAFQKRLELPLPVRLGHPMPIVCNATAKPTDSVHALHRLRLVLPAERGAQARHAARSRAAMPPRRPECRVPLGVGRRPARYSRHHLASARHGKASRAAAAISG